MNITINTSIEGENGGKESWSVLLNQDELTKIVSQSGVKAGNAALEHFVEKYVTQFKTKLSSVVNR